MTDEETISRLTVAACDAFKTGSNVVRVHREELASLLEDSRNLRALLEALPKCQEVDGCEQRATYSWWGSEVFACDEHVPSTRKTRHCELPYAAVLRDILASELRNV